MRKWKPLLSLLHAFPVLLLNIGWNTCFGRDTGTPDGYVLFSNRLTDYRITLGANASPSERWAAEELQRWLHEISGADFIVEQVGQPGVRLYTGPRIWVGYNETVKEKLSATAGEPMAAGIMASPGKQPLTAGPSDTDESFRYFTIGQDILISGGRERGTLYGVMSFLENEFGCRWYTPSVTVIPRKDKYTFSHFDHAESPGIRVRNDFYFEAFDTVWAARNKMNGRMGFRDMKLPGQPGGVEAYWDVHTFYPLVPPAELFEKHPEYYSLIDGKRTHEEAQLCLTNPHVLQLITERIKKRMRESPEYLIYDVSQNDNYKPCQCDNCQRIVHREGSESGPIIWFVNQVAASVAKEFPGKFIGTLAYQYTRTPPRNIRPLPNVVVRLCPIEACVAHPLESCPQNKSFLNDLQGWSAIAPHLYIWDYVVNFGNYIMPYPNIGVLQPNIRLFRDNHTIGIMEQAAYQSRGGEFAELKSYLIARLLWNPEADTEEIVSDFLAGYYGRSGKCIRAYLDLLQSRVTPETHMHINISPKDTLFAGDLVSRSVQLFEKAAIVADNEEILRRVEMASLPVLYLHCKRNPAEARKDGSFAAFTRIAAREKITHYNESDDAGAARERLAFEAELEKAE